MGVEPSSVFHHPMSFDSAIYLAKRPAAAGSLMPPASLRMPRAHRSMSATMLQLHIQPSSSSSALAPPPGQRSQDVTMTHSSDSGGLLLHRQHYRSASIPDPGPISLSIPHLIDSSPSTHFAQCPIPIASRAAVRGPYQHTDSLQQHEQIPCPGHRLVHTPSPMDVAIPLEGRFVSWTATREGDQGMDVSLDEALEDFVASVDAEMKGGRVIMPPGPLLSWYHPPGRYVEEASVGKGIIRVDEDALPDTSAAPWIDGTGGRR
ncbi:hypothetical protein BDW66DRAFT_155209 [Aspergillus desertorum]